MNDSTTAALDEADVQPGVRGWLLVLCVVLTFVAPAVSAGLMAEDPTRASYLTAIPVLFGVYAGIRLWFVLPRAVETAKLALLLGVAVDVVVTTVQVVVNGDGDRSVLSQIELAMLPSLVFFTACYAYLNKSKRVQATYRR